MKAKCDEGPPKIVIYHDPCPDGYMSFLVFQLKYLNCISIRYQHHNKEEREKHILSVFRRFERPSVYFLDLCPSERMINEIISTGSTLTVCDHHQDLCLKFQNFYKTLSPSVQPLIKSHINFKKSGCQLTWEMLFPGQQYPVAVLHIGNKDVWNFSDDETEPFTIGYQELKLFMGDLMGIERNSEEYNKIIKAGQDKISTLKEEANQLLLNVKESDKYVDEGYSIIEIESGNFLVFKYLINALKKSPFDILRIKRVEDGKNVYSLRALKEIVTVDGLARKYGGNGHPKAAGYSINI